MSETLFQLSGATNVGFVRKNNEDNFIVCRDLSVDDWSVPSSTDALQMGKFGCLLVVADGMGGMNAGEVASQIAIDSIREFFSSSDLDAVLKKNRQESFLKQSVVFADSRIKQKVKEDPSTSGLGTTLVMVWVIDSIAHICWCGDSRAYLLNKACVLTRLSKDHSYVQRLVDEGKLSEELAFDHPDSNIITRSLGDTHSKANPDYVIKKISKGDTIMLCSDGLCGYVRDNDISNTMYGCDDAETCCKKLVSEALDAGGYDNVTVIVFQLTKLIENQLNTTTKIAQKNFEKTKFKHSVINAAIMNFAAKLGFNQKWGNSSLNKEEVHFKEEGEEK